MLRSTRLLIPVAVVMMVGMVAPHKTEAGSTDATAAVEDFFDRVNASDFDGAAALLADDFLFTEIHEQTGSFATVGKQAFAGSVLEEIMDPDFTAALSGLDAEGNVVTGVAEFSDDETSAAAVDRRVQPFTITLNDDGELARADFTFDESDPQTATYLEYHASQEGEDEGPPAGSVTVSLAAQSGGNQPGIAVVFEDQGLTVVGVFVEPGAAGVLQPAHFHTGTCASPGPIVQPLASVLDGSSLTLLSAPQDELIDKGLIINVHKSVAEATAYVSCGEVLLAAEPEPTVPPAATPTAGAGTGVTAPSTGTGHGVDGGSEGWRAMIVALFSVGVVLLTIGSVAARLRVRSR